jgi:hypothetical protein
MEIFHKEVFFPENPYYIHFSRNYKYVMFTPDRGRSCPEFESGSPHSLLNGARNYDCVS